MYLEVSEGPRAPPLPHLSGRPAHPAPPPRSLCVFPVRHEHGGPLEAVDGALRVEFESKTLKAVASQSSSREKPLEAARSTTDPPERARPGRDDTGQRPRPRRAPQRPIANFTSFLFEEEEEEVLSFQPLNLRQQKTSAS
jgi:hypothetical protein